MRFSGVVRRYGVYFSKIKLDNVFLPDVLWFGSYAEKGVP